MLMADMNELLLQLVFELIECPNGLLLRLMRRPKVDGFCCGLFISVSGAPLILLSQRPLSSILTISKCLKAV